MFMNDAAPTNALKWPKSQPHCSDSDASYSTKDKHNVSKPSSSLQNEAFTNTNYPSYMYIVHSRGNRLPSGMHVSLHFDKITIFKSAQQNHDSNCMGNRSDKRI